MKIANPFLKNNQDNMTELNYIFDNQLNHTKEQKMVFSILSFMKIHEKEQVFLDMEKLILNTIAEDSYHLIKKNYIEQYNTEKKQFQKYSYLEKMEDGKKITDAFYQLYFLIPELSNIAFPKKEGNKS